MLDHSRITAALDDGLRQVARQRAIADDSTDWAGVVTDLLARENAVLIAHYYTDAAVQRLAEETGGCVTDSLDMARFGAGHPATTLVIAGVRFMAETAKILTPGKRVLLAAEEATCSLDIGCPADEFAAFCDRHPNHTVVVYANTSAAVKARSDWVVTSSIALEVVDYLDARGEQVLWAPDRHLGNYISRQTGAQMLMWQGSCIVHDEFKTQGIHDLQAVYPDAAVLAHPESPAAVLELADVVGSTSKIVQAVQELPHPRFIVATDKGIFYQLQRLVPDRELIEAPTAGNGATCKSCARCPWMEMNSLRGIAEVLRGDAAAVQVDEAIARRARRALQRMLDFQA